mgnify:CR=1 FL=1
MQQITLTITEMPGGGSRAAWSCDPDTLGETTMALLAVAADAGLSLGVVLATTLASGNAGREVENGKVVADAIVRLSRQILPDAIEPRIRWWAGAMSYLSGVVAADCGANAADEILRANRAALSAIRDHVSANTH